MTMNTNRAEKNGVLYVVDLTAMKSTVGCRQHANELINAEASQDKELSSL